MKVIGLRLALQTAVLAIVFAAAGRAEDRGADGFSKPGLQAKLEYCKTCHGLSAQGYRGYYPMPRLAGQQPLYVENQLRAFIERRRTNPVMQNVAHVLSPSMVAALAEHLKELNPPPIGGAPENRWPWERQSSSRDCLTPTFPRAPLVTVRRLRVKARFPVGGSALLVHRKNIDELEQRARSRFGAGYISHHAADDA